MEMNGRIQLVLDSAPMGVSLYDSNRTMIDCNMEAVRMFGFTTKEGFLKAFKERYFDFFPSHQPCGIATEEKIPWLFEKAETQGKTQLEWMHLNNKGEELPTEVTFVRVDYKDSFIFVAYVRDLREVKAAEAKEREAAEFGNTLYEVSPVFVDIWDENLNLIDCNNRVISLFGVSSKEEFIKRIKEFYPEYQPCGTRTKDMYERNFKQALNEGFAQFNFMHLDVNGNELPVEATYVRITRQGKHILVGYNHDLRQIKKAQNMEIAEESNRAKSRFLARMSHEIRTPITAVLGISEIQLRSQIMTPQTEEAFAKIYDSSKTLLSIVNDILDFSKIESGKMSLVNDEYNVASLVSDIAQLHMVYLDNKNISFQMHIDEKIPAILIGDILRIKQIINNLLTNAFKYTSSGSVSFTLHCEAVKRGQVTLIISIRDTGMGMTAQQLAEIKDLEYVRLHEKEKPFVSGTGLGVPIVYSLVQIMNASINYESEVGNGTHVTVRIPQETIGTKMLGKELANKLEKFESNTWSSLKEFNFTPEPMPHGKVLIVDDVDINLDVAEAMLEIFGLNIETCQSGQAAINKITQGNTYDIIFMDQMMPEMDGMQATKILREMGYTRPIVALTANALKGQAEVFMTSGFNGFLSKPLDINRLNSYLVRFINICGCAKEDMPL